jgi:hypothetical protein
LNNNQKQFLYKARGKLTMFVATVACCALQGLS